MELEESNDLEELHIGDVNLKYKLGVCGIYVLIMKEKFHIFILDLRIMIGNVV